MTRADLLTRIDRCDRAIAEYIRCQGEMWRTEADRVGAALGEVDNLTERRLLLEELELMDRKEAA